MEMSLGHISSRKRSKIWKGRAGDRKVCKAFY